MFKLGGLASIFVVFACACSSGDSKAPSASGAGGVGGSGTVSHPTPGCNPSNTWMKVCTSDSDCECGDSCINQCDSSNRCAKACGAGCFSDADCVGQKVNGMDTTTCFQFSSGVGWCIFPN